MRSSRALALVTAAVVTGTAVQYLFVGQRVGINVLLAVAVFLGAGWSVTRPTPFRGRDAWCAFAALGFAIACAVRADGPLLAFDVVAAIGLSLAAIVTFRGVHVTDLALARLVVVAVRLAWSAATGALAASVDALPAARQLIPPRSSPALRYAAGGVLALPLLVVFGMLFSSADAVFAQLVDKTLDLARLRDLFVELPVRGMVAITVAWCAAGAFAFEGRDGENAEAPVPRNIVGGETAIGALVAIDALFLLFVGLQITYLFGGRDTLDAAGITYSAYARRGFFELVAVAALVAAALFVLEIVTRTRARVYVGGALSLVLLTLVVLASAAIRMDLYQQAYGWTELRFYASAGIAFLTIALVIIAWAVLRSRMTVALQRLTLAGLGVALVVNAIGPAAFIAGANLRRAIDPAALPVDASRDLDIGYLIQLGDGAVPTMVDALPSLPDATRLDLERALARLAASPRAYGDWRSWNFDHERARELLAR